MRIFVTVGTTAFDELIRVIDALNVGDDIVLQISNNSVYMPINYPFFKFSTNIEKYYNDADIVITHGGAGSVYRLLELEKKIVIVPNLNRVDKHQKDLSDFMQRSGYAWVCEDLNMLSQVLNKAYKSDFKKYRYDSFFKADEILQFIRLK